MLKYNRAIVFCSMLVLLGYFVYFFMLGYMSSIGFAVWAGLAFLSLLFSKKNPHWAFLGLTGVSIVFFYLMKYYIPQVSHFPTYQLLISIQFAFLGAGIDGLYWVYKWERGKKVKTGYDD